MRRSADAPLRSFPIGGESGDDGAVVGADAPVRNRWKISFVREPVARHRRTQQEVIKPRDGIRRVVAIALGGARVGELEFSAPDDGLGGIGTFHVVEITEDDYFFGRIAGKMFINEAAQNF